MRTTGFWYLFCFSDFISLLTHIYNSCDACNIFFKILSHCAKVSDYFEYDVLHVKLTYCERISLLR